VDKQGQTSKNVIDRRAAGTHGVALLLGLLAGWFGARPTAPDPDAAQVAIISTALDRGQAFWAGRLPYYRDAKVVIFTTSLETPCGIANDATGPFYCPADERVYVDPAFLRSIPGEFARAYVIAHELGHHVQKLTAPIAPGVGLELQADCYAGVWMSAEQRAGHLHGGEVAAALDEAAAAGDAGARDTWTHGDAASRVGAVTRGLTQGACPL
jgi:predicted metalloprotease